MRSLQPFMMTALPYVLSGLLYVNLIALGYTVLHV